MALAITIAYACFRERDSMIIAIPLLSLEIYCSNAFWIKKIFSKL